MDEPELSDFGLSPRHFRLDGHHLLIELAPAECPNGHPLGGDHGLAGNHPCVSCTGSSHRIWLCRECPAGWIWPACVKAPTYIEWAGVDEPDAAPQS